MTIWSGWLPLKVTLVKSVATACQLVKYKLSGPRIRYCIMLWFDCRDCRVSGGASEAARSRCACAAGGACGDARAANRREARDPLWEPADETRDVTTDCTPALFCNPSVSGAGSEGVLVSV